LQQIEEVVKLKGFDWESDGSPANAKPWLETLQYEKAVAGVHGCAGNKEVKG
jgi:hypothetical protein